MASKKIDLNKKELVKKLGKDKGWGYNPAKVAKFRLLIAEVACPNWKVDPDYSSPYWFEKVLFPKEVPKEQTIKLFFAGNKPIEEKSFNYICLALGVTPEDIAAPIIEEIKQQSKKTAAKIKPRSLNLVRRENLIKNICDRINLQSPESNPIILPLLGDGGVGKSIIVKLVFEEIVKKVDKNDWIALVRGEDIDSSESNSYKCISQELGRKTLEKSNSIIHIVKKLKRNYSGKGYLLVDSVDKILNYENHQHFKTVISKIMAYKVSIIFTCRKYTFNYYFSEYIEAKQSLFTKPIEISNFNDNEIEEASSKDIDLSIVDLNTKKLISKPLILDLFLDLKNKFLEPLARSKSNINTNDIFNIYWQEYIEKASINNPGTIYSNKVDVCFDIAKKIYIESQKEKMLYDRTSYYEILMNYDEKHKLSYANLRDQKIIVEDLKNVTFFHQKFTEYVIAKYLFSTLDGKKSIKYILEQPKLDLYLQPILCEYFKLIRWDDFSKALDKINKNNILFFRALVNASVSHNDEKVAKSFGKLIIFVKKKPKRKYAFHLEILAASRLTRKKHIKIVLKELLSIFEEIESNLSNLFAEVLAQLFIYSDEVCKYEHNLLFTILKTKSFSEKDKHTFLGKFIFYYDSLVKNTDKVIDLQILEIFKNNYFEFGSQARSTLIDWVLIYASDNFEIQRELLLNIYAKLPSKSFKERENLIELTEIVMPQLLSSNSSIFGNRWENVLDATIESKWDATLANCVARKAKLDLDSANYELADTIFKSLVSGQGSANRNKIALQEIAKSGQFIWLTTQILKTNIILIPPNYITSFCQLLKTISEIENVDEEAKLRLVEWICPKIEDNAKEVIMAIDMLANNSLEVKKKLDAILCQEIEISIHDTKHILKKCKNLPRDFILSSNPELDKEKKIACIAEYSRIIDSQKPFKDDANLFTLCNSKYSDVAKSASHLLPKLAAYRKKIDTDQLIVIIKNSLEENRGIVRQNCIDAFIEVSKFNLIDEQDVLEYLKILSLDSSEKVVIRLFHLIKAFMFNDCDKNPKITNKVFSSMLVLISYICTVLDRYKTQMVIKEALVTISKVIDIENPEYINHLVKPTRDLIKNFKISTDTDKNLLTGILNRLAIYSNYSSLLSDIVSEDCFENGEMIMPEENQIALIVAIINNQGINSELIKNILDDPQFSDKVKQRIRLPPKQYSI